MSQTYFATLHADRIEWQGEPPQNPADRSVRVAVTFLDEIDGADQAARGRRMAELLKTLSESDAFGSIADPATWQTKLRQDRELPGRDE